MEDETFLPWTSIELPLLERERERDTVHRSIRTSLAETIADRMLLIVAQPPSSIAKLISLAHAVTDGREKLGSSDTRILGRV